MTLLADKENRRYVVGLSIFAACLLAVLLLLSLAQTKASWSLLQAQETRIASALLDAGVSKTVVAEALSETAAATPEGEALLNQLGHGADVPFYYFAALREQAVMGGAMATAMALLLGSGLMLHSWRFLKRRERLYLSATDTIAAYAEGHFERHLPQHENGALYQLFGAVEELALSLQAKGEHELQVKDFLKGMISDISHQVKTPLAALHMYNEIIAGEPEHVEVVRTFSEKSERALERLEQLIQSLLKVTRLDAGSVAFVRRPQNMAALMAQAAEPFVTRAKQEGKTLSLEGATDALCCCDSEWTAEAIGNLIKNGLDHTAGGGQVRVRWEETPALLRITVADNGEGIAAEDLHHIFKRFYRSPQTSDHQGVGLGLPIAKAIVDGQGGTMNVASAPGEGTVFTVSFPACGAGELTKM